MGVRIAVGDPDLGVCCFPREPCVVRASCCLDKRCDGMKAFLSRPASRTSACGVGYYLVFGPVFLFISLWLTVPVLSLVRPPVVWNTSFSSSLCVSLYIAYSLGPGSRTSARGVDYFIFSGADYGEQQYVSPWCRVLCL